jgi:hypothetical protein
MLRRTYGSVVSEIARICGSTGMSTADPRVMAYVNAAIEELMNEGDWPTIIDRLRFKMTTGHLVLPGDYDRMLYCTIDRIPRVMQSPWFEFVGYGLDTLEAGASVPMENELFPRFEGVLDKDAVATFENIDEDDGNTYYPRVYGTADERISGVRPNIIIQGYDSAGNWIRTSDGSGGYIDGISIAINGDTTPFYIQSSQSISNITGIIKPVTKNSVLLYASTATGSVNNYIGQYISKDTTPIYRQYSVPGLGDDHVHHVLARCRRRFVPVTGDNDFLLITNLPALKAMVQAVYYLEANMSDDYMKNKTVAVDLLQKEAKAYVGLQRQKPLFTMNEGTVSRSDGLYIL